MSRPPLQQGTARRNTYEQPPRHQQGRHITAPMFQGQYSTFSRRLQA
nr:MAG TPA: hypothetical protein [Caudoviricetes sp.]